MASLQTHMYNTYDVLLKMAGDPHMGLGVMRVYT